MAKYTQQPRWRMKTELLRHGFIYFDTLCCDAMMPAAPAINQLFSNEIFEVNVITEGNGIYQIFSQEIPCNRGDIFIIPSDIPHNCYVLNGNERMLVSRLFFDINDWFDGEITDSESSRYCYGIFRDGSAIACATLNAKTYERIMMLLNSISQEAEDALMDWQDVLKSHLMVLFITLSRYIGEAEHTADCLSNEWHYVSSAMRMVKEKFSDSGFKLETIAETLNLSKSHFSRLFSSCMGTSFSAYLRNMRLQHACELLGKTSLPVEEIVYQCGLRDIHTFYRNFQNYIGVTPYQYRIDKKERSFEQAEKNQLWQSIADSVQQGKSKETKKLVQQALDKGYSPKEILNEGLLPGIHVVSEKFKSKEVFVPEVMITARAMNIGIAMLKPLMAADVVMTHGRVCIGTVQGDLHDIGKNLVKLMMESNGLEVIDLGTDVPPRRFVEAACEQHCQVICCSALLTTTMDVMAEVVREAERAGIRSSVRIMVGGAPVTEAFCQEIGADCYTPDAVSAAEAALAFCVRTDGDIEPQKREEV